MEKSLKDLISRLPIPGLKESNNRHVIAEAITNTLKIPVKPNQITFKDNIITVSVQPVVKSALQVKQTELLSKLNEEGIEATKIR
jgi:hypothetical protein